MATTTTVLDEFMTTAHMTEAEIRRELAVTLFQQEKVTMGQGARLAGMSYGDFQFLLAGRKIPIHYGIEEMEEDLRTIEELRKH